jgi:hypothetical protein
MPKLAETTWLVPVGRAERLLRLMAGAVAGVEAVFSF